MHIQAAETCLGISARVQLAIPRGQSHTAFLREGTWCSCRQNRKFREQALDIAASALQC